MSRGLGLGLGLALRDALAPVAPAVALLTQLGDTWLLLTLALVGYLLGPSVASAGLDREAGVRLVALALAAFAVTRTLKAIFAAPRPPVGPPPAPGYLPDGIVGVYEWLVHTSSAGFPSGHAIGATAVWGSLAVLAAWRTRQQRFALAAAIVTVVAASRLALGLHYLVDVLAGVAVGLVLVAVLVRVPAPAHALGLATGAAAVGLVVIPDEESAAILGAIAAATVVWVLVGDRLEHARPEGRRVLVAAVPLAVVAAGSAVVIKQGEPSAAVVAVVTGLVAAATTAVPLLLDPEARRNVG